MRDQRARPRSGWLGAMTERSPKRGFAARPGDPGFLGPCARAINRPHAEHRVHRAADNRCDAQSAQWSPPRRSGSAFRRRGYAPSCRSKASATCVLCRPRGHGLDADHAGSRGLLCVPATASPTIHMMRTTTYWPVLPISASCWIATVLLAFWLPTMPGRRATKIISRLVARCLRRHRLTWPRSLR